MGKRVLMTGGSTGIGNAALNLLVADGHEVTNLDVKDAPAGATAHFHCDMSDPTSIDATLDQLSGRYDALLNIAGVAGSMGAELVLRVNVYGLRHLTESCLARDLLAEGASIVNIASLAGMAWERHLSRIDALDAAPDMAAGIEVAKAYEQDGPTAYVLSKEWVVAYTQRLAGRTLGKRIRVNSVSPGPVETPLFPYFQADTGPEQMAWFNTQVGRVGQPVDQARVICWLAVSDADWVNGVDIPVDGGLQAGMRTGWVDTKASPASQARRAARG